jgi:flagellar basal-body rod modification protein FlgD
MLNGQNISDAIRTPKKVLDQQDFMKLLAVQFTTQDPMKPMEDTAFISQMAQFSSLEQANQTRKDQQMMTSTAYLGRNVTVQDGLGKLFTGVVSAVDNSGTTPALVINGTNYPLSAVKRVEPNGSTTTTPADPTTTTPIPNSANPSATDQLPLLFNLIRDRVTQGI